MKRVVDGAEARLKMAFRANYMPTEWSGRWSRSQIKNGIPCELYAD
jgi:hypothetical protein